MVTALHRGVSGVDGFATYSVARAPDRSPAVLTVDDLHADSDSAYAGLWRFLLSVDLVDEVSVRARPMDDPLELMLADPRACAVEAVRDETWLRLLDVPRALAERRYGTGEPVVIEVVDRMLEANSGTYRVASDGAERSGEDPQLRMDVDTLAALYLGDRTASGLARAGRIRVLDAAALPAADQLFVTPESPWCGTFF